VPAKQVCSPVGDRCVQIMNAYIIGMLICLIIASKILHIWLD